MANVGVCSCFSACFLSPAKASADVPVGVTTLSDTLIERRTRSRSWLAGWRPSVTDPRETVHQT